MALVKRSLSHPLLMAGMHILRCVLLCGVRAVRADLILTALVVLCGRYDMTSFPCGETVVMLQPAVRVDDLGDNVEDWSKPVETVYHNVAIYASLSQEDEAAGRDSDYEHWSMLFKQPVKGAGYRCRWRIRGVVWEADGSPMVWHHPMSGWDAGTQVNVKRKKG